MFPTSNFFVNQQQKDSRIAELQGMVNYWQNQLQQVQSTQPYQQIMPQQVQQPIQQQVNQVQPQPYQSGGIPVHFVDDFDKIPAEAVPMDNNGALFIKRDGTEIQVRKWNGSGEILPDTYLLTKKDGPEREDGSTEKANLSDEFAAAFMQRFDDIANRLERLESVVTPKPKVNRAKKESEPVE